MSEPKPKPLLPRSATDQLPEGLRQVAEQLVEGDRMEVVIFQNEERVTPLPGEKKPTTPPPSAKP